MHKLIMLVGAALFALFDVVATAAPRGSSAWHPSTDSAPHKQLSTEGSTPAKPSTPGVLGQNLLLRREQAKKTAPQSAFIPYVSPYDRYAAAEAAGNDDDGSNEGAAGADGNTEAQTDQMSTNSAPTYSNKAWLPKDAGLQPTKTGVGEGCPQNTAPITDDVECRKAAEALKNAYSGRVDSHDWPPGCFYDWWTQAVRFNDKLTSPKVYDKNTAAVCKAAMGCRELNQNGCVTCTAGDTRGGLLTEVYNKASVGTLFKAVPSATDKGIWCELQDVPGNSNGCATVHKGMILISPGTFVPGSSSFGWVVTSGFVVPTQGKFCPCASVNQGFEATSTGAFIVDGASHWDITEAFVVAAHAAMPQDGKFCPRANCLEFKLQPGSQLTSRSQFLPDSARATTDITELGVTDPFGDLLGAGLLCPKIPRCNGISKGDKLTKSGTLIKRSRLSGGVRVAGDVAKHSGILCECIEVMKGFKAPLQGRYIDPSDQENIVRTGDVADDSPTRYCPRATCSAVEKFSYAPSRGYFTPIGGTMEIAVEEFKEFEDKGWFCPDEQLRVKFSCAESSGGPIGKQVNMWREYCASSEEQREFAMTTDCSAAAFQKGSSKEDAVEKAVKACSIKRSGLDECFIFDKDKTKCGIDAIVMHTNQAKQGPNAPSDSEVKQAAGVVNRKVHDDTQKAVQNVASNAPAPEDEEAEEYRTRKQDLSLPKEKVASNEIGSETRGIVSNIVSNKVYNGKNEPPSTKSTGGTDGGGVEEEEKEQREVEKSRRRAFEAEKQDGKIGTDAERKEQAERATAAKPSGSNPSYQKAMDEMAKIKEEFERRTENMDNKMGEDQGTCTLNCDTTVQNGWSGKDEGNNACNSCDCIDGFLQCTEMVCPDDNPCPEDGSDNALANASEEWVPATTTLTASCPAGTTILHVKSSAGFDVGQKIRIKSKNSDASEINVIASFGSLVVEKPVEREYGPGSTVTELGCVDFKCPAGFKVKNGTQNLAGYDEKTCCDKDKARTWKSKKKQKGDVVIWPYMLAAAVALITIGFLAYHVQNAGAEPAKPTAQEPEKPAEPNATDPRDPDVWKLSKLPQVWFTSSGLQFDDQLVKFVQTLLLRRGVLEDVDAAGDQQLDALREKYASELAKIKVLYICDSVYHKGIFIPEQREAIVEARVNHDGAGWHFWDRQLVLKCGIAQENVTLMSIFTKPWLFDHPGDEHFVSPCSPGVAELDPQDKKEYDEAFQKTVEAYKGLKADPPELKPELVGCGQKLAELSLKLNEKYSKYFQIWEEKHISGSDVICGQGGDVAMLNLAFGCNQMLSSAIYDAVRANKALYIGQSAGCMVAAYTVELTHEITPDWLKAFEVSTETLAKGSKFTKTDLDNDGTNTNVLGALNLIDAPMAFRPHYTPAWEAEVNRLNKIAEQEYEKETGIEIDDKLVDESSGGCSLALRLLNHVVGNQAEQDNPVFIPLRNGEAFLCEIDGTTEVFRMVHEHAQDDKK